MEAQGLLIGRESHIHIEIPTLVIANKGFCVGIISLVCIFSESPLMPQGFPKKCCEMLQNTAKYCKNAESVSIW